MSSNPGMPEPAAAPPPAPDGAPTPDRARAAEPTERERFPGDDLVTAGLADIAARRRSVEALLVATAGPRLARAGVTVPEHDLDTSGRELYALLEAELGNRAHSRYNALQRRVIAYCVARTQDARRRR
ncbi:MAG: hypothetical protein KGL16_00220 [Acidobacteriota bacterium]|nr:hypothetical protein [Acidobacteriota bacterium]